MFGPRKTQHFHGRHWSIFTDCFDSKMKRKWKTNIRKPLRVRLPTKLIFLRICFPIFFFIIPFEHSLVKFPTVYSFFFLQTMKCLSDNTIKIIFLSSFIFASVFNKRRNVYTGYHHLRRNLQIKLRKFLCMSNFPRWLVASI